MSRADFKRFEERDFQFRNSKGKVKQPPVLPEGVRVADAHCHLNMLDDPAFAIAKTAHYGFGFLECITDPAEEPRSIGEDSTFISAAGTYDALLGWLSDARAVLDASGEQETPLPRVRIACGVHPHNAKFWQQSREELVCLLHSPLTSCLGEIGLDYHYDFSPREVQRAVFAEQLELAQEAGLPVELHLREAHADALAILREVGVPQAGCVVHCFNLGPEDAAPFIDLDCYISLGGPLTFRKSWYTRLAALDVPLKRLLTETDAPYMAPEPLRGVECEPAHTVYTLRMLLDACGFAGDELAMELVQPRQIDIDNGVVAPSEPVLKDSKAMQSFFDGELGFCNMLFENATQLLDREPTAWQLS